MDTLHKILDLLWKKGISEIDFCNAIGINKSAVTDWKRGKTTSYKKYLPQISGYFGVSVDYLLGRVDAPNVELIPADPEKVKEHEEWQKKQREDSYKQLADAIKKAAPEGEQPVSGPALDLAHRIMNLSPQDKERALDYLELLESQHNAQEP